MNVKLLADDPRRGSVLGDQLVLTDEHLDAGVHQTCGMRTRRHERPSPVFDDVTSHIGHNVGVRDGHEIGVQSATPHRFARSCARVVELAAPRMARLPPRTADLIELPRDDRITQ